MVFEMDYETKRLIILWSLSTIAIWGVSWVFLMLNRKNRVNQWAFIFTFLYGFGTFSFVLEYFSKPFMNGQDNIYSRIFFISDVVAGITYYFTPYAILIFGIAFWEYYSCNYFKYFKQVILLAAIPTVIMYIITPLHPVTKLHFTILSTWATVYFLITYFLMYKALQSPSDNSTKIQKIALFIPTIVISAVCLVFWYILRAFGDNTSYRKLHIAILCLFLPVFVSFFKIGSLGVRLKIEKHRIESSTRASLQGTQLINHGIKNEIAKVKLSMQNIKRVLSLNGFDTTLINDEIKIVDSCTEHIQQLIFRIRSQTGEFEINKTRFNVYEIVNKAIEHNSILLSTKKIQYKINIPQNIELYFDISHFKEVLNNIIKNSFEALHDNGLLEFSYTKYSNQHALVIKDNGKGISSEDLNFIFEPFFTTKKLNNNFGLGLTYCYNVMLKHDGDIKIIGRKNSGATVYLIFPNSSVRF